MSRTYTPLDGSLGYVPAPAVRRHVLRAGFDAARTTAENRRHWANADALSARAVADPETRRVLRNRSRYEAANNCYARRLVDVLASYAIGAGPLMSLQGVPKNAARVVEEQFWRWCMAVNLGDKVRLLRTAQAESGEGFALLATNRRLPTAVKLDLLVMEADQIASPWTLPVDADTYDGIRVDSLGDPLTYYVLDAHPGDTAPWTPTTGHREIPAGQMLHLFRPTRPGQVRGLPDLTPALPLFALLRTYTLAVIGAAEAAARPSGVVETDTAAESDVTADPGDAIEPNRGELLFLPHGWKMNQIKAEQPTSTYGDFKWQILGEIGACYCVPAPILAGDSSRSNFASGRLDTQAFMKRVEVDRANIEARVLNRVFAAWHAEARMIEGYLPDLAKGEDLVYHVSWFWPGVEHVDPGKEASAAQTRLASLTTNLSIEYARQGRDWEIELRQRSRELELCRDLNLPVDAVAPSAPAPGPGSAPGDVDDDTDQTAQEHADARA